MEIRKAFAFGTPDPYSVEGFVTRFLLLAVPGTVLGHVIDELILLAQQRLRLHPATCLLLQTASWVVFFFVIHNFLPHFGAEFQNSYAGLAFVTLFFTVQTNYVTNLQVVLRIADRTVGRDV